MSIRLTAVLAGAGLALAGGFAAGPAPAPTRNGGRHRTVAQDQRRAAKRRATHRAKRLGHR